VYCVSIAPVLFIQASMSLLEKERPCHNEGDRTPKLYGPYVVQEKGKYVINNEVLCAIYGMLADTLLWYR
jgi:hypothetical protein